MKRLILLSFFFCFTALKQEANAQIFNTKLKITVLDELGNFVPDAEVTLYASLEDYKAETNPVQKTLLTDSKGKITFKKLENSQYYVIVRKGDKDNSGGGELIGNLEKGKVNKANVVISEF